MELPKFVALMWTDRSEDVELSLVDIRTNEKLDCMTFPKPKTHNQAAEYVRTFKKELISHGVV